MARIHRVVMVNVDAGGASLCLPCPPGHYSAVPSARCLACPAGLPPLLACLLASLRLYLVYYERSCLLATCLFLPPACPGPVKGHADPCGCTRMPHAWPHAHAGGSNATPTPRLAAQTPKPQP
jgi:hypothetical protein